MRVSITGATGFIGRALHQHLTQRGETVNIIGRELLHLSHVSELRRIINRSDVIINLAGETIDQRWSPTSKSRIIESRTRTTRTIVSAINRARDPKLLISASAVGIYPTTGCHNDFSRQRGRSFLTEVCRAWEGEAQRLDPRHSLTITRFGVVLAPDGGALKRMMATARFGFMMRFGGADSRISWISREDLIRAILYIIECDTLRGIVNICATEQTTQQQLMDAIAPITLPLPSPLLRLLIGEAAEVVLANCCATPHRLITSGFKFTYPTIESYLLLHTKRHR